MNKRIQLNFVLAGVLIFAATEISAQDEDSIRFRHPQDIAMPLVDCTDRFFERSERVPSMGKTLLVTKERKTMSMTKFFTVQEMGVAAQHAVIDLDNDGKKELVIYNFTGGAHCCDEFYFFKNTGPNKYQYVAKTFAGDGCVNDSNVFRYSFYQSLGYFFTCYACGYLNNEDDAPITIRSVQYRYNKGKLQVIPGNQELRSVINDNLGKLGELPYEELDPDLSQDSGVRKEIALNLAVYYYSFGKNLAATQQLFNKYYKHKDAAKVWQAFAKELQNIRKQTDL